MKRNDALALKVLLAGLCITFLLTLETETIWLLVTGIAWFPFAHLVRLGGTDNDPWITIGESR